MRTKLFAASLLCLATASCSSKPDLLSGNPRHRVPINTVAAMVAAQPPTPAPAATPVPVPPAAQRELDSYRFHFAFNKTDLLIPQDDRTALLLDALEASHIYVRGRTDGSRYSAGDERIAIGRANAAKQFLVSHGIDASKIRIDTLSGGGYIAPNDTPAGRALNRRVEIQPVR